MKIKIVDLSKLKKANLTIDEFLALVKVYNITNKHEQIDYNSDKPDTYFDLEKRKLIKLIIKDKEVNYILREKGRKIVESFQDIEIVGKPNIQRIEKPVKIVKPFSDKEFEEFWSTFPSTDAHGYFTKTRILKSNKTGCKNKYLKYLLTGIKHEDIIKALKHEIKERKSTSTKSNNLTYMKNSYTWLNQKEFEVILESMKDDGNPLGDWTSQTI